MSNELTPAQKEQIRQQRLQKFRNMGLPEQAGQISDVPVENIPMQQTHAPVQNDNVINEQVLPVTNVNVAQDDNIAQQIQAQLAEERMHRASVMNTAPRDKFAALEAIKRGAKKQELSNFIKAESPNQKFQEIKVSNRPKRGVPQEKSEHAVAPQGYQATPTTEASALENMFTDGIGISVKSTSGVPKGSLIEVGDDYSGIGPAFDPVSHLKAKAASKGVLLEEPKYHQGQVFQTENTDNQMSRMLLMMESFIESQKKNTGYDAETLSVMIETIAKKVAEKTIRDVLKEYTESQKKKPVFEIVDKTKGIIKISNKQYQLKPLKSTD